MRVSICSLMDQLALLGRRLVAVVNQVRGLEMVLDPPDQLLLQRHVAALEDPGRLEERRIDDLVLAIHVVFGPENGAADCRADRLGT